MDVANQIMDAMVDKTRLIFTVAELDQAIKFQSDKVFGLALGSSPFTFMGFITLQVLTILRKREGNVVETFNFPDPQVAASVRNHKDAIMKSAREIMEDHRVKILNP